MDYETYIKSPQWRALSQKTIDLAGGRCRTCNATGPILQAHHRTYERLGNEDLDDLTCLCQRCHLLFHSAVNTPSRPVPKAKRSRAQKVQLTRVFVNDLRRCGFLEQASVAFNLPLFSGRPLRWVGKSVFAATCRHFADRIESHVHADPDPVAAVETKPAAAAASRTRSTFRYHEWKARQSSATP